MAGNRPVPISSGGRAVKPPRYQYSFFSEIPLGAGAAVFYGRREIHPRRKRPIDLPDIKEILLLCFYLCVAAAVPARHWERICRFVSGLRIKKHRRKLFATLQRDLAAIAPGADPEAFFRGYLASLHRRRLYYMAHVAGWHWRPRIIVEGDDEVRRALARGKGALIWCESLAAQTLLGKRALHEAGIEAYQAAARGHGLSTTAFGRRVLNPIPIGIENPLLKGRLGFGPMETLGITRRILEALRSNAVVLVAANTHHGHRFVQVPIGEGGYAHFATAPANFLVREKTTLLSMSTVETVPFTEFKATIRRLEQPAGPIPGLGASDRALAEVIANFRDAHEKTVLAFPAQCLEMGRYLTSQPLEKRPGFRA